MQPVLTTEPVTIYAFGTFVILGLLVGGAVTFVLAKRRGLSVRRFPDWYLATIVVALAGAHLWYLAFNRKAETMHSVLALSEGLALAGGLLCGGVLLGYLVRRNGSPVAAWYDAAAAGVIVGVCIGQIGALLGAASIGTPTEV